MICPIHGCRRCSTGRSSNGVLHTDQAGWTNVGSTLLPQYTELQSKIGCNFHPTSAWAEIVGAAADFSVSAFTDRARGAASLTDGDLEYVLHRHASGGNGRGPTDRDTDNVRGTVAVLPTMSHARYLQGRTYSRLWL